MLYQPHSNPQSAFAIGDVNSYRTYCVFIHRVECDSHGLQRKTIGGLQNRCGKGEDDIAFFPIHKRIICEIAMNVQHIRILTEVWNSGANVEFVF